MEIVTEQQPSAAAYGALAQFAYLADQMRKGDLAAAKAVELAPDAQKKLVRRQLADVKRQIVQQQPGGVERRAPAGAPVRRRASAAARAPKPALTRYHPRSVRPVRPIPGPLAQLAEQGTLNPKVGGSIPPRPIAPPSSAGFGVRRLAARLAVRPRAARRRRARQVGLGEDAVGLRASGRSPRRARRGISAPSARRRDRLGT